MDYIKEWALGLVLTSVIGTVILVLSPSGSMEKQVKLAVSLVLLIMFIKPLNGMIKIKDYGFEKNGVFKESVLIDDSYFVSAFKDELNRQIISLMNKEGVEIIKTEINVSANEASEVVIDSVVVFISDPNKKSTVKALLAKEYGILAEVEVSD